MIIEIGCNQDVTFLLSKYNKTKEVIWENDKNTYIVTAKSNGSIIGFAFVFRAYCDINNIASHYLWLKNGFGISPVKIKEDIVGSYATFGL